MNKEKLIEEITRGKYTITRGGDDYISVEYVIELIQSEPEEIRKLQEECDFWEREAKRYCAALGEQKIKLQRLKCEMCKDIGNCSEC